MFFCCILFENIWIKIADSKQIQDKQLYIQNILTNIYKVSRLLRTYLYKKYICVCNNVLSTVCFCVYICWKTNWISTEYNIKQLYFKNILTNVYKVSRLLRTHLYKHIICFVTMCCQQCVILFNFVENIRKIKVFLDAYWNIRRPMWIKKHSAKVRSFGKLLKMTKPPSFGP